MHTYSNNSAPIILAHRGGAGEASEHSLQAYQKAVDAGCTYLELDVRLGAQGELVLQHGRKSESSRQKLTLSKLIETFPNCYFAIDPKEKRAVRPLAEFIIEHDLVSQVCIGASMDSRALQVASLVERATGIRPAVALVSAWSGGRILLQSYGLLQARPAPQADFLHLHNRLVTQKVVAATHQEGLKLITWGVDGFMTDVPSMATELARLH